MITNTTLKAHYSIVFFLALLVSTSTISAQTTKKITLINPLSIERPDELVVIKRKALEQLLGTRIKFVSIKKANSPITVQHDDLDRDNKWDEVAFVYSFKAKETVQLIVSSTEAVLHQNTIQRAHVRMRKKNTDETFGPALQEEVMPHRNPATDFSKQPLPLYLTEGPAWENDRVAFRLYFDVRNGKDIFGKRTSKMMMDSVGLNPKHNYHELADWGMDILHAGKSLGSGALALMVKNNGEDTLIRLGGDHIKKTVYKELADGPVRAMFTINYDWEIQDKPVQVEERISIWAGQDFYESVVTVIGAPAGTTLVEGVADFNNNISQYLIKNNSAILLSHGIQSENKDNLGMAIVVPAKTFSFAGSTPKAGSEILDSYICAQNITTGKTNKYRFYAGWEVTDKRFASFNFFKEMILKQTLIIDKPIIINL